MFQPCSYLAFVFKKITLRRNDRLQTTNKSLFMYGKEDENAIASKCKNDGVG